MSLDEQRTGRALVPVCELEVGGRGKSSRRF